MREERIRQRAYEIYEYRQHLNQPGDALSDWRDAEEDIRLWEKFPENYKWVDCK